jgi:beta-glucosidase/6-phospho-beta-glucosidase/beta-galactosidase
MGNMFPSDFLWGAATAGYQVEGDICNNDWDFFTSDAVIHARVAALGKLASPPEHFQLRTAGAAVHHANLHVLKDDLDRCRALGMNAYRFSVEWSRLEPHPGDLRADVLENYYVQVVREIKARHMEPVLTLHHMTLPHWVLTPSNVNQTLVQAAAKSAVTTALALAALLAFGALAALGLAVLKLPLAGESRAFQRSLRGWESAETVDRYIAYVRFVVTRLREEGVKFWLTLNEPVGSLVGLGYLAGVWPAGFSLDGERAYRAYLHLLKAHVRAYHAIKALQPDAQVSLAHHMALCKVSTERVLAGRGDNAAATRQVDYFYHQHFLDAVIDGRVDVAIQHEPARRRYVDSQQFFGIAPSAWQPTLDFIGLNYYRAVYVRHDPLLAVLAGRFAGGVPKTNEAPSMQHNDLGWEVFPEGLYAILKQLARRYKLAIFITENGMAEAMDKHRASYIISHVQQVQRACREGVDVMGYLYWSIVDNYEWAYQYEARARFGLFHVNRTTLETPAGSFPRHITEGARAMQAVIALRDADETARCFGAYHPSGRYFVGPVQSPGALWQGKSSTGEPLHLLFTREALDRLGGMLFYPRLHRWLPLETVQFHAVESTLSFSHPAQGTMPARRFEATVTGRSCNGVLTESTASVGWSAAKHPLFGIWRTSAQGTYITVGDVESAADLSGTKFKRGPAAPWSLIQSVTLTDGNHVRLVLDAVLVDSPSGGTPELLSGNPPPVLIARAAMVPRSTKLVLRGFTMTLTGDVMTGKELERDVPARLDRLPDRLPFG